MSSAESTRLRRPLALATAGVCAVATSIALAAPAHADEVYPRPYNSVITLDGHGWGHGHGMSQWGAQGAALKGLTWQQITTFYYPGTAQHSNGNPTLRVHLTASSSFVVQAQSGLKLSYGTTPAASGTALPTALAVGGTSRTVTHWHLVRGPVASGVASKVLVQWTYSGAGKWITYATAPGGQANLQPTAGTDPQALIYNSVTKAYQSYRGEMRFILAGTKGAESSYAVLALPMETYLRGVVPSEMPASWQPSAVRSQAVAARTYAEYEREHPLTSIYDTCDTTQCQVFGPVSKEDYRSDDAVSVTGGQVLTYGTLSSGAPAAAFSQFSASNGGWMAAGDEPYLVAKADPYDGVDTSSSNPHSWSTSVNVSAVETAWSQIGTYRKLEITARDGHGDWGGRITKATVVGSAGSVDVTGEDLRKALGLRSEWFKPTNPVSAPSYPRDLTGDHKADVVAVVASTGELRLYPGSGAGGWLAARTLEPSGWTGYPKVFTAGTWDGDALSDVMAVHPDGTLWLYSANPAGGLETGRQIGTGWGGFNTIFPVGDFNGDGNTDLLARRASDGALFLYPGDGVGGFRRGLQVGNGWGGFTAVFSPGDFTGDGVPDVLARAANGYLYLYPGNGTGGFQRGRVVGSGWNAITALTSPGDFTGDGKADVLARMSDGTLRAYMGNGAGGWIGWKVVGSGWNIFSTVLQ